MMLVQSTSKHSTYLPAIPPLPYEAPTSDPLSSPSVEGTSPHLHACDSNPPQLPTAAPRWRGRILTRVVAMLSDSYVFVKARSIAYPPLQKENGP
jgi:hypothetical protein